MVRTNSDPKHRRVIAPLAGIVAAVFLVAALAPLALAAPDGKDRQRPPPEKIDRARHRLGPEPPRGGDFTLNVTGSGLSPDNGTYEVELRCKGHAQGKTSDDGLSRFRGRAVCRFQITDANGTVVKDGRVRVMVRGFEKAEGEWKWELNTFRQKHRMPKLVLHGNATPSDDGVLELAGTGHAVFHKDGERRATPLKLVVEGSLARA